MIFFLWDHAKDKAPPVRHRDVRELKTRIATGIEGVTILLYIYAQPDTGTRLVRFDLRDRATGHVQVRL